MIDSSLVILRCPLDGGRVSVGVSLECENDGELLEGILECASCTRWFRVERGVPDLVPDSLRDDDADRAFVSRHRAKLPERIESATAVVARSEHDQRVIDEGRHWGAYMKCFWDVGDRSVFDLAVRGDHPRFYSAGILERDERDRWRPYGFFPTRAGSVLFKNVGELRGMRAIDVGCGGGQMALAFAAAGLDVIGFDPSFEAVAIAREHARDRGMKNVDYVRAVPSHPPFAAASFDVFLAKDSLHHVPELAEIMEKKLVPLLRPGARAFVQEHVGSSELRARILERLRKSLGPRILRRYARVAVPKALTLDSANEDVAQGHVREIVRRHFESQREFGGLWLDLEIEALVYYAFGRRGWVAKIGRGIGWLIELAISPFQPVEHWSFRGKLRK